MTTGVVPNLNARDNPMFTENLDDINEVKSQCNVLLIPTNLLRKTKKCKKLLPVGNSRYKGTDLGWDETLCRHRQQMELLDAEVQAIDLLNNLSSDVKTPRQCEKLKEN